mgnify:CR=1 FL=1|jgi:uncharacterized membrane protein YgdD (TMEM256/DUF423 family)
MGASGVALGAFGAHGLKGRLGAALPIWETAVQYHLVHALFCLVIALALRAGAPAALRPAAFLALVGILLFSGSLYALALGGPRWLGPITPLGGLAFLLAWGVLLVQGLRS